MMIHEMTLWPMCRNCGNTGYDMFHRLCKCKMGRALAQMAEAGLGNAPFVEPVVSDVPPSDAQPGQLWIQPAQAIEPRALIRHFAAAMEVKLGANDGKGDFRDDSEWNHLMYAEVEMDELKQALADYRLASLRAIQLAGFPDTVPGMDTARTAVEQARAQLIEARQAVLDECADVANYLMFAAGVIGALPLTDERGR